MARPLTFQDVMNFYESAVLTPQISPEDTVFMKAMINTGMGLGVWNPIYGAQAWYNLNAEANWFGIMPKMTWDKSGFRTINSFTRTPASMGISETGTLPTPTAPVINVIKLNPKIAVNTFMTTEITEQLAKMSQDDIYANLDVIRGFYAVEHAKLINMQIGSVAVGTSVATSNSGQNILTFESIDRIVSSYAEGSGIGLTGSTTPTLAQVINPYYGAIDRSQGPSSWDSFVLSPSGTFGTPAAITDEAIRKVIQGARMNGAFSNVFMTGYDTYADLQGLYVNQLRYLNWGELTVKTGLNGIETATGLDTGLKVATMYGIPLIQAINTPSSNGLKTNIYLLDTTDTEGYGDTRLGIQVLRPTSYLETTERDFILLNALAYEGMYVTIGEIACRFFAAQAKIRDLE
ncbi:MAG: hypothetical protein QXF80_06810 [Thermoplasmatales archaeon]